MKLLPLVLVLLSSPVAAEPSEEELVAWVTLAPSRPEAQIAAHQLLELLDHERRFDEADAWADRMLAEPALLHRRLVLTNNLVRRVELARFKRADAAMRAGAFDACASLYEELIAQAEGLVHDYAARAGECALRASQPVRAIRHFVANELTHVRTLETLLQLPAMAWGALRSRE